ncbi:helix-turn-helix transcriptional regulator [Streptomyces sp. 8L]|uniref:helix-turn-helix transcriptional regulator n=1 Tax=Streptomyces sp. 8L TaxID=2877242 RepID=UPI001CD649C3|nr:helix-turn-helix transcriptional regulator [Streptomyces sp. 8L]MCA1219135.1 helix-turn-helix transcriptional regulator [Streptomyces sp. 8L]
MSDSSDLGVYLRARRDLVSPGAVGIDAAGAVGTGGRRRVPGLRREEVALLAGISSEYYLRLERGRDLHPSPQVVDALARALLLDEDATAYLHGLAGQRPRRRPVRRRAERVGAGLEQFVLARTDVAAFVQGRYQDVLVANVLATALSPWQAKGVNLLQATFLDPGVRAMYGDQWPRIAEGVVASVRALAGPENRDAYLERLVGELSVRSEEFRALWARHDVRPRTSGSAVLRHPQVGELSLRYEKLAVPGADGQRLVLFHAVPGSPAADALALLSHLAYEGTARRAPDTPDGNGPGGEGADTGRDVGGSVDTGPGPATGTAPGPDSGMGDGAAT